MTRTAWGLDTDADEHWSVRGACRKGDPDAWTDVICNGQSIALRNQDALRTCRVCPVIEQCREDGAAMATTARAGQIIGGVFYGKKGLPSSAEQVDAWLSRPPAPAVPQRRRVGRPTDPTTLQPCGTYAAYQRHRRQNEEICEPCRAAKRAHEVAYRVDARRRREMARSC
jgi:hypothetical protein